jgi:hydrogenase maturation factor
MCIAEIAVLEQRWDQGDVAVGRLGDGRVVPLTFVPDAPAGSHLICHLGIPVEVITTEAARAALALQGGST